MQMQAGEAIPPQAADLTGHCGLRNLAAGHAERGGAANRSRLCGAAGENESQNSFLPPLLLIPGLYRLVPGVFVKSTRASSGQRRALTQRSCRSATVYGVVDMMKCPYHDTCVAYGCPELCCCFCDSDDISYTGLHPKLIWHRTKTLGRGDDRCDFCMKIMK